MKSKKTMRCLRAIAIGTLVAVSVVGGTGSVCAQDAPAVPAITPSGIGHATKAWLDLQGNNVAAAPVRPMLGEEAGLAYQRYMESFKSKIPDLYGSALNQSSGSSGGSGGSGSGSGSGQPPSN